MSEDGRYAAQIAVVKEECEGADETEIINEFRRYEEEFMIPPEDALRSVVRKFQIAAGKEVSNISVNYRGKVQVLMVWPLPQNSVEDCFNRHESSGFA